jgi:hypothetical protein
MAMRPTAQNRLENAPRRLWGALEAPIAWRHARVAARDAAVDSTLRARPLWRERAPW